MSSLAHLQNSMQLISSISVNMVSLPNSQDRVRLVRFRLFLKIE